MTGLRRVRLCMELLRTTGDLCLLLRANISHH